MSWSGWGPPGSVKAGIDTAFLGLWASVPHLQNGAVHASLLEVERGAGTHPVPIMGGPPSGVGNLDLA